ncbi:MAG TPA: hypothetical protein VNA68_01790 [Candidatus Dormibacteraeota bacterium]|nr:hypothetical protein [Candidatus Dormibacteraeota bacterium]
MKRLLPGKSDTVKILGYYRRYRVARFLLSHPLFRMISFAIAAVAVIIIWPLFLVYLVYKISRFGRKPKARKPSSKVIDI